MCASRMAVMIARPASGPRGTISMPIPRRKSANQSNSAGGSSCSTTAVTGTCLTRVSQKAHHSQLPRWGRTSIGPRPLARASSTCS
jgi:hypothetical protein